MTIGRALTPEAQVRYAHVDAVDTARVRVVVVPVLTPGIVAITLGRYVLVQRGWEHSIALIGHELVHVEQWRRLGAVCFVVGYLAAYLRSRRAGLGHRDAYRAIPFEQEARLRSGA